MGCAASEIETEEIKKMKAMSPEELKQYGKDKAAHLSLNAMAGSTAKLCWKYFKMQDLKDDTDLLETMMDEIIEVLFEKLKSEDKIKLME
jgi:hypothetical protein